jgi:hypothetical protein
MPNQLKGVKITGAIPISIAATQIQIIPGGETLHMSAFPFAIG